MNYPEKPDSSKLCMSRDLLPVVYRMLTINTSYNQDSTKTGSILRGISLGFTYYQPL